MIRRHLAAALCPGGESCAGAKPASFLQQDLLWSCSECGRVWRCRYEGSAAYFHGVWVWRPAPWYVRWTVRWFGGRWWHWADEAGAR